VLLGWHGRYESELGFEHRLSVFGTILGVIYFHADRICRPASRRFTPSSSGPGVDQRADCDSPDIRRALRFVADRGCRLVFGVRDVHGDEVVDDVSAKILDGERRRNRDMMESVGEGK